MMNYLEYIGKTGRDATDSQAVRRATGSQSAQDGFLGLRSGTFGGRIDAENALRKGEIVSPFGPFFGSKK